ncbi:tumor protein D54-like isoform X2 [Ruditapes philippinarum]|uniref:tumor protein D54-like isoform X2 n=1 Tax=Ruditapes philippinarum TaxID=129788 RepID=UPI00295A5C33|nr:tumor protein D54-like isoform X2 [Ruditapes philippinarum]
MSSLTESDEDLFYTPKISSPGNFRRYLDISRSDSLSEDDIGNHSGNEGFIDDELFPDTSLPEADLYPDLSSPNFEGGQEVHGDHGEPAQPIPMSDEQKKELQDELEKVEGEIATLRQVLGSKIRYSAELKRKLGITPLQEMKNDFQLGIKTIKDSTPYQKTNEKLHDLNEKLHQSPAYQKTSAAAKSAAEKTSTVVAGIGSTVSRKLGDLRNSQTFKSVEGKMESAYAQVKAKVSGSKSEGNFEEALQSEKEMTTNGSTGTPETVPEEKVPL